MTLLSIKKRKSKWAKPELIVLTRNRPEETVLSFCKTQGIHTGPAGNNCRITGGGPPQDCEVPTAS